MCGIAGIVDLNGKPVDPIEISRLTDLLAHRGPGGSGTWFSGDRAVALGHRRLAIIDPGEGGRQPMEYADGRYVIVYNGEVYNFLELRRELEARGSIFRSESISDNTFRYCSVFSAGTVPSPAPSSVFFGPAP